MATPPTSSATTNGIRVEAQAFFIPEKSDPEEREFLFGYNITLENTGDSAAQLLSRHWIIIDAVGRREEVKDAGVVGQTPRLEPGQVFRYQSYCPLRTPWGTMEGSYTFRRDNGQMFDAKIGRFYLVAAQEAPVGAR